jgi:hypothetical protein
MMMLEHIFQAMAPRDARKPRAHGLGAAIEHFAAIAKAARYCGNLELAADAERWITRCEVAAMIG